MARLTVYSSSFIEYVDSAPNTSFLVPDGYVAVIRQISLVTTAGSTVLTVNIQNDDEAPFVAIAALETLGFVKDDQRAGRWPVPAGGTISIFQDTLGVGAFAWVSGYLLQNS